MKLNYAIVFVSDMELSITFYRDVLGLSMKFSSSHWSEFLTGDATLALHLADSHASRSETKDREAAGSSRPGLQVQDLDSFHDRMMMHHVECLQVPSESFGSRIAKYADPDGLVISVSEARSDS